MVGRDRADRKAEQTFEQVPYRSQQRTGPIACLVEADHRVPTRIEREIPAGNEHAESLLSWSTVRWLVDSLVSQHPHLGVHHSTAWRINRDNGPLKESEHPARGRQGDLADLAEHGDLVCVGPQSVNQLNGLVRTAVCDAGGFRERHCSRRGQKCPKVERERHSHGRLQAEGDRWPHRVDKGEPVRGLEHQACSPAAAISAR